MLTSHSSRLLDHLIMLSVWSFCACSVLWVSSGSSIYLLPLRDMPVVQIVILPQSVNEWEFVCVSNEMTSSGHVLDL